MERLRLEKSICKDEIIVESECIKTFGENYQAVKSKNHMSGKVIFKILLCFFVVATAVLGVLVFCGV